MKGVVERILERDSFLSVIDGAGGYETFYQKDIVDLWGDNPDVLYIEEGMFFYGMVRLLKPERILETGTNLGLSARFMGLALEDNEKGTLLTVEHDRCVHDVACGKLESYSRVLSLREDATNLELGDKMFDVMFFDTEFITRFREMERYWNNLNPGGVVWVHDGMSVECERFGRPPDVQDYVLVHLYSPHGLLMFQKGGVDYHVTYD